MIQEYYRQMRKFGCNILAVVQQYDVIKDSAVRGAMIGNSKILSAVGLNEVDAYFYAKQTGDKSQGWSLQWSEILLTPDFWLHDSLWQAGRQLLSSPTAVPPAKGAKQSVVTFPWYLSGFVVSNCKPVAQFVSWFPMKMLPLLDAV